MNIDFDIKNITVTAVSFPKGNDIEYKSGRRNNLLHLVLSGTREYFIDGKCFLVEEGGIIFIPKGTVYRTVTKCESEGIGVCFDMIGAEEILVCKSVYSDWKSDITAAAENIRRMDELIRTAPSRVTPLKALIFDTLCHLANTESSLKKDYELIKPAIKLISTSFCENLPVCEYARVCNISESYFRRIFSRCMGMTLVEYRNELRFILARGLYREGKTLAEIAEATGFFDAGFFSKAYKKKTGTSLKNSLDII